MSDQAGLWPGAEVRLRSGAFGVVVHPGAALRDGVFFATRGEAAPAPVGVRVELTTGEVVDVDPSEVELVVPMHPARGEPDATVAFEVIDAIEPLSFGPDGIAVRAFVPASYEAFAQVLHPWTRDDTRERLSWQEVARERRLPSLRALERELGEEFTLGEFDAPSNGQPDLATMRVLTEILGRATTTPDDVEFLVWEGWGDNAVDRFPGAGRVDLQPGSGRGCFLVRGPIEAALVPAALPSMPRDTLRPMLWWPADRAWTVSTDVDLMWTLVAGRGALIDRLVASPDLEVLRTTPDATGNGV